MTSENSGSPPNSERSSRPTRRFSLTNQPTASFRSVATHTPSTYPNNNVSTTKYTPANFFFKNMAEQFSRMANVYFLIISILTSSPISPKDPISLVGTFVLVLLFSAAKEGYEDLQRHKSDEETNTQVATVVKNGQCVETDWRNVVCGDVLRVSKDEAFPADIVILSTTDTDHGLCFIDTCNIDGETNLKTMNAIEYTKKTLAEADLSKLNVNIECENPNPSLYTFSGSMEVDGSKGKLSIGVSNVLLRGCILRQSKVVYGVAIFTGHDTKLMKNAAAAPFKVSYLMKMMNRCLIIVFAFQAFICAINTVFAKSFKKSTGEFMVYASNPLVRNDSDKAISEYNFSNELELDFNFEIESFLTFVVAYANLVPISLYVALEIVKLFQVVLIDNDLEIYHAETNTPTVARTSNLVEELGQVRFIFSDKTGTLTCNVMEFACCSIGGKRFHTVGDYAKSTFLTEKVYQDMASDVPMHTTQTMFWQLLSVCHNVLPEYPEGDDGNMDKIKYQASSPDEAALVMAAKEIGFQFCKGTPVLYQIINTATGEKEAWKILATIEFNSTRKRMSLIVESPEGKKLLFCKGADNIIIDRLDPKGEHMSPLKETTEHLVEFAEIGLRTLCLAYKELTDDEYNAFDKDWSAAMLNIHAREEMQDAISEEIEKNLVLVGATAIEDKLQDGVPEAIETLADAGIKLWVLTGDKQETAINIGFSCRLLAQDMHIHILSGCATVAELKQHVMEIMMNDVQKSRDDVRHAIVIDGATLTLALNEEVRMEFLQFGLLCDVCICCRVSPKQKAEVVKLVKDNLTNPPVITLAIGDGANDVSMIQAAHIGIGISGQEGMQAVRASDFSIAQFRFLTRLLIVHGSWAYKRVAKFILFYFYKNMANVLTEYFFAFETGFSGQILFADWLSIGYNAAYSSFGCIFGFCLDQDVNAESVSKYPRLYEFSMFGDGFDMKQFATWMAIAVWHGGVCYFIPYGWMYTPDDDGKVFGHWFHGTTSFVCLLIIVHFKMATMIYSFNYMVNRAVIVSIGIFFVTFFILCQYFFSTAWGLQEEMLGFDGLIFANKRFYLCIIITPIFAIIPDCVFKYLQVTYAPQPYNILHENELGWKEGVYQKKVVVAPASS